ncbi:MAG TPA: GNAT family N-acetyltransferase [Candidatus Sulfomarinibacteraceae bacterium]|nr:GNAT family N-acetyltransferase [Candidatus Sulfomarinibacteraceae bacterium]
MDKQTLRRRRKAIRQLLDERKAEDAMAAYYAFYHPDERTSLYLYPDQAEKPRGYLAASRTGIDLFRPLLTLRLPDDDPQGAADLIYDALEPGASVFIHSAAEDGPLLSALFDVHSEQRLLLYRLDRSRFEPIVNVLVMRSDTPDGKPRFIIRPTHAESGGEIGASASLNWQTRYFAEVTVYTNPQYRQRGWGRSVVAALADELLHNGQLPLYEVSEQNEASINLAESVGFVHSGVHTLLLEATLRERPG